MMIDVRVAIKLRVRAGGIGLDDVGAGEAALEVAEVLQVDVAVVIDVDGHGQCAAGGVDEEAGRCVGAEIARIARAVGVAVGLVRVGDRRAVVVGGRRDRGRPAGVCQL